MPPEESRQKLLEVRNLRTYFDVEGRTAKAVDGVSFHIFANEVFGLVGESGSGKSVASLSIMRLIPNPPGRIESGEILFRGKDLLALPYAEMRKIRGNQISMIFQEPMTALNPVFTIGFQLREAIRHHQPQMTKAQADARAVEMLELVGIPDAPRRLKNYPSEFSGGMRQRAMIAMALALEPALLIADEPTTALDVTIQAQILQLIRELQKEMGMSVLLITHDLGVVAQVAHHVCVMYAGKVVEYAPTRALFKNPRHPYTVGLFRSIPKPGARSTGQRLDVIPGRVPTALEFPDGCRFHNRCPFARPDCATKEPPLRDIGTPAEPHTVACHYWETVSPAEWTRLSAAKAATEASA